MFDAFDCLTGSAFVLCVRVSSTSISLIHLLDFSLLLPPLPDSMFQRTVFKACAICFFDHRIGSLWANRKIVLKTYFDFIYSLI